MPEDIIFVRRESRKKKIIEKLKAKVN